MDDAGISNNHLLTNHFSANEETSVTSCFKPKNFLCCSAWEKLRKFVALIVFDPFVFIFLALCIILDVILMTLYHHGMSKDLEATLESANYFFTIIFALEIALKVIALHPKDYIEKKWYAFEFIVIALSVLEVSVGGAMVLSVLRSFRLLGLLKLAPIRCCPTISLLLSILERSLSGLMNLLVAFLVIVTIFATIGMHLFGKKYIENIARFPDSVLPSWNFIDFQHSFMIVFRALCGEWIEPTWHCMLVSDFKCIPFFLSVVLLGRFVIFSLFLALVLNSFGSSSLSAYSGDAMDRLLARVNRILAWIKTKRTKLTDLVSTHTGDAQTGASSLAWPAVELNQESWHSGLDVAENFTEPELQEVKSEEEVIAEGEQVDESLSAEGVRSAEEISTSQKEEIKLETSLSAGQFSFEESASGSNCFCFVTQLVATKYFGIPFGILVVISCVALAFDDVDLQHRPVLQRSLYILDVIVAVSFFMEMLLRWLNMGLPKYFRTSLCLLDFIVIICCLTNLIIPLFGCPEIRTLKAVRALKILRILKTRRFMRVVINILIAAIPPICSGLFLCALIWFAFAMLGVRLFAGKYFKCVNANGSRIGFEEGECLAGNYTWQNSNVNFDHVGNAYLSLFRVATFEGWIQIMRDAVGSGEFTQEFNLYFVMFIITCSFFAATLFIGIVIDNYREQKARLGGRLLCFVYDIDMYYNIRDRLKICKPVKAVPRPQRRLQAKVYGVVQRREFEMFFIVMIGLNMLALTVDNYQLNDSLGYMNLIFLAIFTAECALKMFAFRHHYFKDAWNLFDLSIVLLSGLALVLPGGVGLSIATLSLARVIRVAKIGELLRKLKCAKKIRNLLLVTSACSRELFNIVVLLFIVIFIFAIFGMSLFMHVKKSGLDDAFNFRTFWQAIIVLVQVSTMAGWDEVLDAITNEGNCEDPVCGNVILGYVFLLTYIGITYLIMTLYVAVTFWHQSKLDEASQAITVEDCAMFNETWQRYDPDATHYIQFTQLSDFLDALEPPLRVSKPNKFQIIARDVPICSNERIFFGDALDAAVADALQKKGWWYPDYDERNFIHRPDYEAVSSTLWRQAETHNAKVIQRWWRTRKNLQSPKDNEKWLAQETTVEVETDGITTKNAHNTKLLNRTSSSNQNPHVANL